MTDQEKIEKAIDCCLKPGIRNCKECPYEKDCYHDGFCDIAMHQVRVMLELQEPIKPKTEHAIYDKGWWWYVCGACGENIERRFKYCPSCGREVLWHD